MSEWVKRMFVEGDAALNPWQVLHMTAVDAEKDYVPKYHAKLGPVVESTSVGLDLASGPDRTVIAVNVRGVGKTRRLREIVAKIKADNPGAEVVIMECGK